MATFAGLYVNPQDYITDNTVTANLLAGRTYAGGPVLDGYERQPTALSSVSVTPYPGPVSTETFGGVVASSFINDWYYRIHVIPGRLDLGNLVSDQGQDIYLWNAFFEDKAFTAFSATGLNGASITQPEAVEPPYTMPALSLLRYEVSVLVSGPPTIEITATWTIGGEEYRLDITGRRVIAFPFPPNWTFPVNETLQFKSTLIRATDGSVQTANLRPKARRIFDYTVTLRGSEAQRADSLLFGWQHRFYAMPVWPEMSKLLAPASAGSFEVSFDTAARSFSVGGLVMLFSSSKTFEVREIDSIVGDTVTFTTPLERSWAAGTRVFPAFVSVINPGLSGNRPTDNTLELPVRFTPEPSGVVSNATGSAAATYLGYELVLDRPNWIDGLQSQWNSDVQTVDLGGPVFQLFGGSGFSEIQRSHSWLKKSYPDIAAFRGFLARRAGVGVPFWMPSATADFTLVVPALSSNTAIDVEQNDYENQVNAHPARRDIIILLRNGSYLIKRISSATTTAGGNTRLVFADTLGIDLAPEDIKRISYLSLYRLASNDIVLNWRTRGVLTCEVTLINNRT